MFGLSVALKQATKAFKLLFKVKDKNLHSFCVGSLYEIVLMW